MTRFWYNTMGWVAWFFVEWSYGPLMPNDAISSKLYGFGNWLYGVEMDYGIKHGFLVRNSHPDAGNSVPIWIDA